MNDFLKQLERKRDLLNQVLQITGEQTEIIESEDTDALLTSIGNRQKLIDQLDAVQAELPDREALRANQQCIDLVNEIKVILKVIQEHDARNEKAARERSDALRAQIKKINDGRKTFGEYEGRGSDKIGGLYINKTK
jgi:hypothetical protein